MTALSGMEVKYEGALNFSNKSNSVLFAQSQRTSSYLLFVRWTLKIDCLFVLFFCRVFILCRKSRDRETYCHSCGDQGRCQLGVGGARARELILNTMSLAIRSNFIAWLLIWGLHFKRVRTFLRIYCGSF